jgi:vacuolar-type H+-ATPase subunit I/STV1
MINYGLLFGLLAAAYVINLVATRDMSADRMFIRGPIVAVLAVIIYAGLTAGAGWVFGLAALVVLAVKDVTPGLLVGTHK